MEKQAREKEERRRSERERKREKGRTLGEDSRRDNANEMNEYADECVQ